MDALASTAYARDPQQLSAIRKQATELEGVFLNTLVKQMMSGIETDGAFGGGQAEETWRSMQSEFLADQIAQSGGIGLADDIMRTLLQQQEAAPRPSLQP
ncbi:MAG: rod-binding protein [Alphaproteobacteria bacterium]|nr:rod-binding protein [Alphaproteobacteria bacterium]